MIRNEAFNSGGACISATIIDLQAGTIAFESNGVVTSTRALTPDEVTLYTPPAPVVPPESKIAAAVTALAALDTIDAPVLPADVFDVLLDVRSALGGA